MPTNYNSPLLYNAPIEYNGGKWWGLPRVTTTERYNSSATDNESSDLTDNQDAGIDSLAQADSITTSVIDVARTEAVADVDVTK